MWHRCARRTQHWRSKRTAPHILMPWKDPLSYTPCAHFARHVAIKASGWGLLWRHADRSRSPNEDPPWNLITAAIKPREEEEEEERKGEGRHKQFAAVWSVAAAVSPLYKNSSHSREEPESVGLNYSTSQHTASSRFCSCFLSPS